jgi:hypothetical protein
MRAWTVPNGIETALRTATATSASAARSEAICAGA